MADNDNNERSSIPSEFPGTIKKRFEMDKDRFSYPQFAEIKKKMDSLSERDQKYVSGLIEEWLRILRTPAVDIFFRIDDDYYTILFDETNLVNRKRLRAIGRLPENANFKDFLDAYCNRDDLHLISIGKDIFVNRRTRKAEAVDIMGEKMLEAQHILPYMLWSTPEEMVTFFDIIDEPEGYSTEYEDSLPIAFSKGKYVFPCEDNCMRVADDVADVVATIWNKDNFQSVYDDYVWLQDCADAAITLYGIVPLDVLVTLVNLRPQRQFTHEQIKAMLLTQPNDFSTIVVTESYICDSNDLRYLPQMTEYLNDEPYYIPPLPMLLAGNLFTTPAKVTNTKIFNFLFNVLGIDEETANETVFTEAAELPVIISEVTANATKADRERLVKLIEELDPAVRKMKNHGFTDQELAELNKKRANDHRKIVRLDERRRKKKQDD